MANAAFNDGFVTLCFDVSANAAGDRHSMVLEGQYLPSGASAEAQPDTLVRVTSINEIEDQFGAGSVLSASLAVAMGCCAGNEVEIFAIPRADAAGSVAAEYEMTITGPATTSGRIDVYMGDSRWNTSLLVTAGETAAQIATNIAAQYGADFPYTLTVVGDVITFVAKNAGTVGNHLVPSVNWHGRNGYMPEGVGTAFAQTVVGSGDPVGIDYSTLFGTCCVSCFGALYGNPAWQDEIIAYFDNAWDCSEPMCFGHAYTYNAGTLGEILPTDTNSATVSRLAHGNDHPHFPWLRVAAYASQSCCSTVDNPEANIEGPNLGVLSCLFAPADCATSFNFAERSQLAASGFVVDVPVSSGAGALTNHQIVNDITNQRFDSEGRENLTFQAVSSRRLATETAVQIAEQLKTFQGLGFFSAGTSVASGTQGTNARAILGSMRAWALSQVGILFSEFDNLDTDLTIQEDFEVAARCQGVPGLLRMNFTYRPPVRVRSINVNAQPQLLNNC